MHRKFYRLLAVVIVQILIIPPAFAEEGEPADPAVPAGTKPEAPDLQNIGVSHATRVFRDPSTGQIEYGPATPIRLPDLSARERNMLNRSDEGLQARVLPNGAVAVDLQGRFQSMATTKIEPASERLVMSCLIDDHVQAEDRTESENAQ